MSADLRQLQSDPAAFRARLLIDTDGGPRALADVLDPWQRDDFTALDPGWRRVVGLPGAPGPMRAWFERPRGHSKTSDIAASVSWALFASRRRLSGVVAAADRDQAALILAAVDRLCRANPWLARFLDVGRERVANRHTGSELVVLASDAASSYGLTPDFVVVDELTHWRARELWDSLLSSAAKRSGCLLAVITNAGFADSWQWGLRETIRVDPAWHFSRLEGSRASWISGAMLGEQRRLLPAVAYSRLWLNIWSSGAGDALDAADIDSAVTLDGPAREAERGWAYVAGLDLGLTRDASALAVIGKHVGYSLARPAAEAPEPSGTLGALVDCGILKSPLTPAESVEYFRGTGRLKLVDLLVCRPHAPGTVSGRVQLAEIERAIVAINERFPLSCLAADPWQARYLIERLQKSGVAIEAVDFTPSNLKSMAVATLEAFQQRQIDLFEDATLIADVRALRVVERSYGFRLESPRSTGPGTAHGDSATALSLALHAARRITTGQVARVDRPFALWP